MARLVSGMSRILLLALVVLVVVAVAAALAAVVARSAAAFRNPNLEPCPDCGRPVSLRAPTCPHCGCPLDVPE